MSFATLVKSTHSQNSANSSPSFSMTTDCVHIRIDMNLGSFGRQTVEYYEKRDATVEYGVWSISADQCVFQMERINFRYHADEAMIKFGMNGS